jgi:hypothetical protein
MRLVRLGQSGPGVFDPAFQLFMLTDASKHDTSFMCVRPASRYPNRRRRPGPSWSAGWPAQGPRGYSPGAGRRSCVIMFFANVTPIGGSLVGGEEWACQGRFFGFGGQALRPQR